MSVCDRVLLLTPTAQSDHHRNDILDLTYLGVQEQKASKPYFTKTAELINVQYFWNSFWRSKYIKRRLILQLMDLAKYYPSDKYDKDERHFTIFQLKGLQWKQPEQHLDKNHVSTGHHETLNFVTSQKRFISGREIVIFSLLLSKL